MHIVYIHQYYCNPGMAGGIRSYEQARRLVARGHTVDVITTDITGTNTRLGWRQTEDDGVRVHWFSIPYNNSMSYARRIRAFAQFMVVATARAARLRADLVFATSTPLTVAVPGVLAAKLRRAPFVFEVRDLWPEVPIEMGALRNPLARAAAGALANFAYRNASEVVALSPGMAAGVTRRRPSTRTTVVPNAADMELFDVDPEAVQRFRRKHEWLGERPLIVYTGALGAVNGVDYLVRAAKRMRELDPGIRVLIVGHGKEWEPTKRLAAELGLLDDTVRMWEKVPKSELPVILGAATMSSSFVRPIRALWENSANKFFDALAAGRPIAINYGGWQADLLDETGAGLVLDPVDTDAAGSLLARRCRDESWLAQARIAAHKLAVEQFSRDLLFDRFAAVLDRAAETAASSRTGETASSRTGETATSGRAAETTAEGA
ncbi:glycosyltransferase family 4 protein [Paractinoplanes brasiliensis]|uniref:Glycosyltransferase involved in cell wall biosynthesis n=1 Tax=Paractinoplanes brasiliensis TaxID=52695 RepID=A0A4V3C8H7_9ACTN|nr:glycosyltransferase family 4 protein [Actinoplanes brasiliensis]TDO41698.1 glycosyltransferase involved in cell wall biosynthesis [Actinoplanes brasiliensis]GID27013.1 glycosyltransferase WbuB [Actinoplanes brasiliensis]